VREAKREVLARCIYAVDLNPMAVELCKVSLWINASVQDRPLSFLDHHIKCGNSLIGATPDLLEDGVPYEAFALGRSGDDRELAKAFRKQNRDERKESKEGQGVQMGAFTSAVTTQPQVGYEADGFEQIAQESPEKAREVYAEYEADPERREARLEADMYTAAFLWPMPEGTDWAPTYGELFRLQREGPEAIPKRKRTRIEEMADEYRFFHWHLEFPEVFDENDEGGFDVVLGNPPWDRIKLEENQFFAVKAPEITGADTAAKRSKMIGKLEEQGDSLFDEFQRARHFSEAFSTYLRESGRYDLTAVGDINTYQIFAGLVRQIVGREGRVGVIVPSGIATDYYTQDYFNAIVDNRELVSLYDFENRDEIFHGVHRSYKFCLLTLTGQGAPEQEIDFTFFLAQPEQLSEEDRHFTLTREDLKNISPNTGACPTFRYKRDAELTKGVYDRVPVLWDESKSSGNRWSLRIRQGLFHMSNDSELLEDEEDVRSDGFEELNNSVLSSNGDFRWPLYEGRMLGLFDHRSTSVGTSETATVRSGTSIQSEDEDYKDPSFSASPRYWVRPKLVDQEIPENYGRNWLIGYKDVTSPTNERTLVASFMPRLAVVYSIRIAFSTHADSCRLTAFVSNLNSFVCDYLTRQSIGGVHVSDHVAKQLPVHPPERYTPDLLEYIVPRVLELTYTAWDLAAFADDVWSEASAALQSTIESQWQANAQATGGGHRGKTPPEWVEHSDQANKLFPHPPFMWNDERRTQLRADLDGLYGHLYGLEREELAYILDTFPIVERKDKEEYGEYRTKRLVLEAYDRLAVPPSPVTVPEVDYNDLENIHEGEKGPIVDLPYEARVSVGAKGHGADRGTIDIPLQELTRVVQNAEDERHELLRQEISEFLESNYSKELERTLNSSSSNRPGNNYKQVLSLEVREDTWPELLGNLKALGIIQRSNGAA
jgi:hypothetical protein